MSKSAGALPSAEVAKMFELDLKNRPLAAFYAWLWPGAGHLYQGRTAKGLLFMICILPTFLFGFYIGGQKVAYASPLSAAPQIQPSLPFVRSWPAVTDRWPFLCQAGIGAVAIPAVIERQRYLAEKPSLFGVFRPPSDQVVESEDNAGRIVVHPNETAMWHYDKGFYFELGTIYTVIAGLLNVLAIYDAYSGPLVPRTPEEKDPDGKDSEKKNPEDSKQSSD